MDHVDDDRGAEKAMIFRFFVLLVGFGLTAVTGVTMIAYLNLFTSGHGMKEYVDFIFEQPDPYIFIIGNLLIFGSIYFPYKSK